MCNARLYENIEEEVSTITDLGQINARCFIMKLEAKEWVNKTVVKYLLIRIHFFLLVVLFVTQLYYI